MADTAEKSKDRPLRERETGDKLLQRHLDWHAQQGNSGLTPEEDEREPTGG